MLRFALGVAEITPERPGPLAGFAARTEDATGVLDPLTARVLLLDDGETSVAVAAYDLIGVPDELRPILDRHLDAAVRVIPCATHTHAGPPTSSRREFPRAPDRFYERLAERTAALVAETRGRLRAGSLRHRRVEVAGVAHNRRVPKGPVDPYVDVVEIRGEGGELAGLWLSFACHPVVLGPQNALYSADFPGIARRLLEERFGAPVIYTTGCCGQINTGHSALDSIVGNGLSRRTPEEAARIGGIIADAVTAALTGGEPAPRADAESIAYADMSFAAEFEPVDEGRRRAIEDAATRALADPSRTPVEHTLARMDLAWLASRPEGVTLILGVLDLGGLAVVFLPGEVFIETAFEIRAGRPASMVVGYAYALPGYIPHASAYPAGGYEVDLSFRLTGLPGPFARGTAARLAEIAGSLLATTAELREGRP